MSKSVLKVKDLEASGDIIITRAEQMSKFSVTLTTGVDFDPVEDVIIVAQTSKIVNNIPLDGLIFDYVIRDGSGYNKRIGSVYAILGGSGEGLEYTDISTISTGNTDEIEFDVMLNLNVISLRIINLTKLDPTKSWNIKTLLRTL